MAGDKEASKSLPSTSDTNNIEDPLSVIEVEHVFNPSVFDEYICLRMIFSYIAYQIDYCIKPDTPLVYLKRKYAIRVDLNLKKLKFLFNGHIIADNETPRMLDMVNGDVIQIY